MYWDEHALQVVTTAFMEVALTVQFICQLIKTPGERERYCLDSVLLPQPLNIDYDMRYITAVSCDCTFHKHVFRYVQISHTYFQA